MGKYHYKKMQWPCDKKWCFSLWWAHSVVYDCSKFLPPNSWRIQVSQDTASPLDGAAFTTPEGTTVFILNNRYFPRANTNETWLFSFADLMFGYVMSFADWQVSKAHHVILHPAAIRLSFCLYVIRGGTDWGNWSQGPHIRPLDT